MRIKQKEQMLTIAQTYHKLCDKLSEAIHSQKPAFVIHILQNAQESAIEWGETVERIEAQPADFIHVLEMLCELYYEISEMVRVCETKKQWKELAEVADEQLNTLLSELDMLLEQMPAIYEVVFMPYKVSMWDCMESVYLAAAQDPNCNAIVVPIPYYNIENNGTKRISNYEGNQMPENIPVTYYGDYDISEHQPDAVFIHNPYDDMNLITSVYPEYYSRNLKKYTNQLVYIPYYSTTGIIPETHRLLAVHKHMDKMVLQSPGEEKYFEGDLFKGKFLPLGSPKFDRLISYEKTKKICPSEWEPIIRGKKVFFYNTSISALLNDTENTLAKMEYVFSIFMNRDDIALIWRPHPLLEGTLRSLRMRDYTRFQDMKQKFLASGVGIYDETPDITQTIALSDVYIGDMGSSVLNMFGTIGKPIFILSNGLHEELTEKEICDPQFVNIVKCQGKLWTFLINFNALCNIDLETGKLHLVTSIPYEPVTRNALVSDLQVIDDNKIMMSPNLMDRIVIYHVDTGEFEYEILPDFVSTGNIMFTLPGEGRYYMIPNRYEALVEYDVKTNSFLYHKDVIKSIKHYGPEYANRRAYICGVALLPEHNKLYLSLARTNKIIVWDLKKKIFDIVTLGDSDKTYGQIVPYQDGLLVREFEGTNMYYWNLNSNKLTKLNVELPNDFTSRRTPFQDDFPLGGFAWFTNHYLMFPQLGNQILEIDQEHFAICKYPIDISNHIKEPQTGVFDNRWSNIRNVYIWVDPNEPEKEITDFWMSFSADGTMMHVDLDTNETKEIQPHLDLDEITEFISVDKVFCQVDIAVPYAAVESVYVTLEKFIDAFMSEQLNNNREEQLKAYGKLAVNLDGTCGQKVYEAVRDLVISGNKN